MSAAATRAAAARSVLLEERGAAESRERGLDALGRGGQRNDRDVVERLGVDAAEPDDEDGHDGIAAHGDDQLGAGRRHPLDEHCAGAVAAGEGAVGGAEAGLGDDVERERPGLRLVPQLRARELDRDRAAELGERGDGVVLPIDDPAVDDRDAGRAEERLRLVLGEPAPGGRHVAEGTGLARNGAARPGGSEDELGSGPRAPARRGHLPQPGRVAPAAPAARRRRRGRCAARRRPGRPPRRTARRRRRRAARGGWRRRAPRRWLASGAVEDAVLDRLPARGGGAVEAGRVVVEDEHLVDAGVGADERDEVALPLAVAPDHRRVVERVRDRGGGREALAQRGRGRRCERGQPQPEPLRLVGAEARVAARAGEDREAPAARPRAADGERLRELEQVVGVGRPRRAGLLDERAEDAMVAGHRAGVRGRGRGAHRGRADLQHRDPDARVRARRQRRRTGARRRRRPRSAARPTAPPARPPGARGSPAWSARSRSRSRSRCAAAARAASRAR